jgi:predicted dehydrogenase
MEHQKIGIGMLGTGWMCRAHNNGYKTAQYMFWPQSAWQPELITIGGSSVKKGQEAAERFGYRNGVAGFAAMLNDPDIDVFDNVAPDQLHVEPTIAAALAGKHVICEKPLAVGQIDARRMLVAVEKAGVKSLCCFNYRFLPAVRLAYELIRSGSLGKLYHFSGKYFQDHGCLEETPAEKVWYVNGNGMGDGVSQGIGSHLIDMARFLIGEIVTVHGQSQVYNKVRQSDKGPIDVTVDEGFFAMLRFTSGATGMLQSLGVASGRRSEFSFEIFGSKGSIAWDVQEPNFLHVYLSEAVNAKVVGFTKVCVTEPNHPFMDIWWPKGHTLGWEHGHVNMIAHFLDCVVSDQSVAPLGATFEDGYRVAVIIDEISESAKSGHIRTINY